MADELCTRRRGRLKNGNLPGDVTQAARCGAKTRRGTRCQGPAMANGRCRMHGGPSTGPRTPAGLERSRRARWKHGAYSQERREAYLRLKAEYAAFNAVQRARHAAVFAGMRLLLKRQRAELRNARRRHRRRARG